MENFSGNGLSIMRAKYLLKNERGEVKEKPADCFRRVAYAVAGAEETADNRRFWEEKFFQVMANLEFLPGGRTLANAGTNFPQLANCFVLPMEDNIEEIFEVVRDSSILKKFGGGVGFSFSKIRPKGDSISGTSGNACGPVALMKILDSASEIFMQDGKRRSGNMVVLGASHPDVLDFITAKSSQSSLPQVNYSLGVTNNFMEAVEKDKEWDLINPRTGKVFSTIKARSIFEVVCAMAWENGDPGLIFLDRINKDNPTPQLGPIEAVNLCGEQPLLPYEACNIGSINLTKFVKASKKIVIARSTFASLSVNSATKQSWRLPRSSAESAGSLAMTESINWGHLAEIVETAVRFLDDVISVCRYPLSKVDRMVKGNRKIGLGVMGWADLLIKLGIPYDSQEALDLAGRLMKFITKTAHEVSSELGREKGSFPNFAGSRRAGKKKWMRNATTTSIAPTGSIAMIAGVSFCIEPLFALSYYKEVMGGVKMPEINQELLVKIKDNNKTFEEILKTGSVQHLKSIPAPIRRIFVTAHEIGYDWHIKMQAAFQKHIDNAVSKTINLPNTATVEDVENAFMLAWKLNCKGTTIYRDKSRKTQVLNIGNSHDFCPKCHKLMVRNEGCLSCPACGYSACEL